MNKTFLLKTLLYASLLPHAAGCMDLTDQSAIAEWYRQNRVSVSPIEALESLPALSDEFCQAAGLPAHCKVADQFSAPAGVTERYTIAEHTGLVLDRYHQFKGAIELPAQVSERDFVLFLSLHDIGKSLAKAEAAHGLHNSQLNQKTGELMYSRRIFKHVAGKIGMHPATVKILSRLLHSDTIGDYLKDTCYSKEAAYNLLVRDAGHCRLQPRVFFDLHRLFHQIDAGSYPTLKHLFQEESLKYADVHGEKITTLEQMFEQFDDSILSGGLLKKLKKVFTRIVEYNAIAAEIKAFPETYVPGAPNPDGPEDVLWESQLWLAKNAKKKEIQSDIQKDSAELTATLYQLRLHAHYSVVPVGLGPIIDLIGTYQADIDSYKGYNQSGSDKALLYNLSELGKPSSHIRAVHGANSGVLIGLVATSATLLPTGMLTRLNITPLSGELGNGVLETGINKGCLSGNTPENSRKSIANYAGGFHVGAESLRADMQDYIQSQNLQNSKFTDEDICHELRYYAKLITHAERLSQNISAAHRAAGEKMCLKKRREHYMLECQNWTTTLSFKIKQLKTLSNSGDDKKLLAELQIAMQSDSENYDAYTKENCGQMPVECGGSTPGQDDYYLPSYLHYKSGLDLCLAALEQEIAPASAKSMEILLHPFSIVFATTVPWQMHEQGNEVNYSGPLTLGKDVPYIFVPGERISFVKKWVTDNVPGKKKPQVLDIDTFQSVAHHTVPLAAVADPTVALAAAADPTVALAAAADPTVALAAADHVLTPISAPEGCSDAEPVDKGCCVIA